MFDYSKNRSLQMLRMINYHFILINAIEDAEITAVALAFLIRIILKPEKRLILCNVYGILKLN